MKKRIIFTIIFIVLVIVWYWTYSYITDKYMCNNWIPCNLCNTFNIIWIETECLVEYPEWDEEITDPDSCLSYTTDHPYVRCPSEHDGKIRYCQKIYCARGKYSENCRTKYNCKE